MAVLQGFRGQGVGCRLVEQAVGHALAPGRRIMLVGTASAGVGNLRFYQRQWLRMPSVERDALVPGTGYPDAVDIDAIPLRECAWLDRAVDE